MFNASSSQIGIEIAHSISSGLQRHLKKEFVAALTIRFGISHHQDRECIILRDQDKDDVEYEDNKQTKAMRSLLKD